ncbi:MAG: hypothetical protein AAF961_16955, partial [Planctomycetota bacterium]
MLVLAFMLAGTAVIDAWTPASRADEPEVDYLLTERLQSDAFQEITPPSASGHDPPSLISDDQIAPASYAQRPSRSPAFMGPVRAGYDNGFVIASTRPLELDADDAPYLLRLNGWAQLRHTHLASEGPNPSVNQIQLKRARLIFSGHAFTPDFAYFAQLDGRSTSGDDIRLLDYFLTYDLGHHSLGLERSALEFKTGRYKIPFTMARYLSGREFEFTDRSVASMYFDANRSLGWG